jgi:iron(III) transport system permease protein
VGIALLIGRFDLPAKSTLEILVILPLFISPFTGLMAWIALGSSKTGFLNLSVTAMLNAMGISSGPLINIWNFGGVVWVMVLFYVPFAYLFTIGGFRTMNGALEEAARTAGASAWQGLRYVTLPLSMPAIFGAALLVFILATEMYTIPGIIGSTAGFKTLSWQIFVDSSDFPVRRAHAAAGGILLLSITIVGVAIQRRATRISSRFVTIAGKGHPSKLLKLGKWRWAALCFIGAYIFAAVVLPICALILQSILKFSTVAFTWDSFTVKHYVDLFTLENARQSIANTLWIGLLSGALCVIGGFIVSYRDVRMPSNLTSALSFLAILPIAVPGLVYGIGLLWVYLRTPLYGTVWVLLCAFLAKFLPYAVVVSRSGLQQVHSELEESARMAGAGTVRILRVITMPLMKPTLIAILFLAMILTMKELSASVLLYTPRSMVLSVLIWQYMELGNYQFAAAAAIVQTVIMLTLVLGTRAVFGIRLERSLAK